MEEKPSLLKLVHEFNKGPSTPATPIIEARHIAPSVAIPTGSLHSYQKFTIFSGDGNKAEASWEAFKFEVESLLEEHTFIEEQVLLGIRRALKGTASDIMRRLGTGLTVRDVITKLNSPYGSIDSSESVMRKFYSCT